MVFNENAASVGSAVFYSEYHEDGRKGPWSIKPKNPDGFLVFKGSDGKKVFAKIVKHPGYPARRMLPRESDSNFMDKLTLSANILYKQLSGE